MKTSSNFPVKAVALSTATRPNGMFARQKLKDNLKNSDITVVDMEGVVLTPSFADEFLGVLLVEIGEAMFRKKIQIVNVSPTSRPLLQQVLNRRAAKPNVDVHAHNALHSRH